MEFRQQTRRATRKRTARRLTWRSAGPIWIVCGLIAAAACTPQGHVPTGEGAEHLRQLAVGYMQYMAQHSGRTPDSEETLKEFFAESGRSEDEIDGLFVSPRDHKPYAVRYNLTITGAVPIVVAHEQDGIDGTKYIAFDFGSVEVVDDERLRELLQDG